MFLNKHKRVKTFVALLLLIFMLVGVCGGCIGFGIFYDQFEDIYNLRASDSISARVEPYDHPLVADESIRLVEKSRFKLNFWILEIADGETVFIASSGEPVKIRFSYVGYLKSVQNNWRGTRSSVEMTGSVNLERSGQPGNTDRHWGSSLAGGPKKIEPYFEATIPLDRVDTGVPLKERMIHIATQLSVDYPKQVSSNFFEDSYTTLKHEFDLIVLTPEEMEEYLRVRKQERLLHGLPILLAAIGILIAAWAIGIGVPNWLAGKLGIDLAEEMDNLQPKKKRRR